jgi:type IV pilus assembly protein PilA
MPGKSNEKGFTLLELLIVVAVIGILAAIAIPRYLAYQERANDLAAVQQIRVMAAAEELYMQDYGTYTTSLGNLTPYGFTQDANVTRTRTLVDKTGAPSTTAFQLTATSTKGTGKTFVWMSDNGGLQ